MLRFFHFLISRRRVAVLGLVLWMSTAPSYGQPAGTRHVLLIGGLGGSPTYTERFESYLRETHTLLADRFGVPSDQVHVLAEPALADRPFVDGVSTGDAVRAEFARLAERVTSDDHVYVVLFGHGSFDGTHARLNIPRRDLDDADFAALLDPLDAGRTVVVNTASASGPFARTLSHPDRIVVTATATGTERDETVFPRFFVEALRTPDADLDKNGGLSVRELFVYAAEQAAQSFAQGGRLATEHALLDDDGDGSPTRFDALDEGADGTLAAVTYLRPPQEAIASTSEAARPLLREKDALQRSIAELKRRKSAMTDSAYYAELEALFVRLARLNERIEGRQNQ